MCVIIIFIFYLLFFSRFYFILFIFIFIIFYLRTYVPTTYLPTYILLTYELSILVLLRYLRVRLLVHLNEILSFTGSPPASVVLSVEFTYCSRIWCKLKVVKFEVHARCVRTCNKRKFSPRFE